MIDQRPELFVSPGWTRWRILPGFPPPGGAAVQLEDGVGREVDEERVRHSRRHDARRVRGHLDVFVHIRAHVVRDDLGDLLPLGGKGREREDGERGAHAADGGKEPGRPGRRLPEEGPTGCLKHWSFLARPGGTKTLDSTAVRRYSLRLCPISSGGAAHHPSDAGPDSCGRVSSLLSFNAAMQLQVESDGGRAAAPPAAGSEGNSEWTTRPPG